MSIPGKQYDIQVVSRYSIGTDLLCIIKVNMIFSYNSISIEEN